MANSTSKIFTREFIISAIIAFCVSFNFYTLLTAIPSYVLNVFKLGEADAGLAGGLFIFGMVFSRLVAGRLVGRIGFKKMLFIGAGGLTVSALGYFFAPGITSLCVIRLINGFAFGMTSNTLITLVTAIIPRERSGEGIGYYSMCQTLAWAVGPTIGVWLQRMGDYTSIFAITMILPGVSLALIPLLNTKHITLGRTEEQAKELLSKMLNNGEVPVKDITKAGSEAKIPTEALRRAKDSLAIRSIPTENGSVWHLPPNRRKIVPTADFTNGGKI